MESLAPWALARQIRAFCQSESIRAVRALTLDVVDADNIDLLHCAAALATEARRMPGSRDRPGFIVQLVRSGKAAKALPTWRSKAAAKDGRRTQLLAALDAPESPGELEAWHSARETTLDDDERLLLVRQVLKSASPWYRDELARRDMESPCWHRVLLRAHEEHQDEVAKRRQKIIGARA